MISLAIPMVVSYLGLMVMNLVDLYYLGQVSAAAIGGSGLAHALFSGFMIFGIGWISALDYLSSKSFGAGKLRDCHRWLVGGVWISVGFSLPASLFLYVLADHLEGFGVNPAVLAEVTPFLKIVSVSLLPCVLFNALRSSLSSKSVVRPAVVILGLANLLNAALNHYFVIGGWGGPRWGSQGSAIATDLARLFMVLAMGGVAWAVDRREGSYWRKLGWRPDWRRIREMSRVGLPSALQMTFEVGVFATSTALISRFSAAQVAAHQIVLNIASLTFMVPLGIGGATAVLTGQALGRGDLQEVLRVGWQGLGLGVGFMALSCLTLLNFPDAIVGFYTRDPEVLSVARGLVFLAGLFQVFDGAQTVASGAYRGVGDTRTSAWVNAIGHWGVGLPVGAYCGFALQLQARGLWIGLSTGLAVVAALLVVGWQGAVRRAERRVLNSG